MFEKESKTIKEKINLTTSPVAVKIFEKKSEINENLEKIEENIMHCQSIITAGKGKSFYATKENLGCPLGVSDLGLTDFPEEFLSGKYFDKMNVTKTEESGKKLVNQVPKMNKTIEAIGYMPLEESEDFDVLVIIAKPRQIFDLIRAHSYINGERVDCNVGGTQSLCGDIVTDTYQTGKAKISFGCIGSHYATELKEDQVIMSIHADLLKDFVEALTIVTQPPKN